MAAWLVGLFTRVDGDETQGVRGGGEEGGGGGMKRVEIRRRLVEKGGIMFEGLRSEGIDLTIELRIETRLRPGRPEEKIIGE